MSDNIQYFRQTPEADYGYGKIKPKKKKPGISKKVLWKTLHDYGWAALKRPDFEKAAEELKVNIAELKLIFKYYWYTPGARGPVTVTRIHYLYLKRKNKIKDMPEVYEES